MSPNVGSTEQNRVDFAQIAIAAKRRRKSLRELPSLLRHSFGLLWAASPLLTVATLAIQVFTSLSLLAQVFLVKLVLDAVLVLGETEGSIRSAAVPVALLAVLGGLTALLTAVSGLQQRLLAELVTRGVWRQVLDVTATVDLTDYEDPDFFDQAQRVQGSAASRTIMVTQGVVAAVGGGLGVAGGVVGVLALAPTLLPLLLLAGVPLYLTSRRAGRLEFDFAVTESQRQRQRSYLQGVLTGRDAAKEVRAFSLSNPLRLRWESNYGAYTDALRHHLRRRTRLALIGNGSSALLTALTLIIVLVLIDRGELAIASAGAALVAVRLLGGRVNQATAGLGTIYECALFLEDLALFLRRRPDTLARRSTSAAPEGFEVVSVDDVSFTYPGASRPALSQVAMQIQQGQVVALVGENGSGKTTLAKLLGGLYHPTEGVVRWDDVDIAAFDPEAVRRRIAVIFQDFIRYRLPARDNIALGRGHDEVADVSVQQAARQAGADAFLEQLAAGYDTVLSKEYFGGVDLSLGQWQRSPSHGPSSAMRRS